MSTAVLSAAGALAKGLATLERLLDSEDEKVALKAAELLLRLHPDVQKRKAGEDDATPAEPQPSLESGLQPVYPTEQKRPEGRTPTNTAPPSSAAARKLLLAPFNAPPVSRSLDPLPAAFRDGTRPLTSFLNPPPKMVPAAPG